MIELGLGLGLGDIVLGLGIRGNLRIKCDLRSDALKAGLELGLPPSTPPDI
jgi:hypothetical protein